MFMNALGELSYNGYTFDGSSKITATCEMVQDEAQRTIVYQKQTFTIEAIVADNADTGETMDDIKSRLGEQGKELRVINRGFGEPLIVNGQGGVRDLKWGPVSKEIQWSPVGANRSCEIVWQITVHLPYCDTRSPKHSGIIAFNYGVSFAIRRGDTQRTISGYLEIAQTRKGKRAPDCADLYRSLLKPGQPDGFEREETHDISPDKSRLNFTIVDTQITSKFAFPAGCVSARGSARAAWTTSGRGRSRQRDIISMELEMVPGVSQAQAWAIFGNIVQRRMKFARDQKLQILLDEVVVEEDIWGRASSFSVGYQILRSCAACLVAHAGLWQPIGTDWTRWKTSMATVFNERGTARLQQLSGDAIVDLCGGQGSLTVQDVSYTPNEPAPKYPALFKNEKPKDPKDSYIDYHQYVIPERDRPVQRQSFLQSPEESSQLRGNSMTDAVPFSFGAAGGTSDTIQESGRSRYEITLAGHGKRAGYEIPRPSLESVGGQRTTETYFKMAQNIVGNWLGVPIYQAYWVGKYVLSNGPGRVSLEPNPKEDVDKNGNTNCKC